MPPADAPAMRNLNRQLVRQALQNLREATRPQLAQSTGLSVVTVAAVLDRLIADDEAREGPLVPSNGGRPSHLYRFNADRSHVLGVFTRETDGFDTVYLRAANLYGEVVDAVEERRDAVDLNALQDPIDTMMARRPSIRALGLGLPGTAESGVVVSNDYPALVGVPVVDHFRRRYGIPVSIENDVNAAAAGFGRRHPQVSGTTVYLYFPRKYPPGAGLLIDGKLHRGRSGWAGEVGHLPLGVPWGDPGLFEEITRGSLAVALTVTAVAAVLNPDTVVLHGEFLTSGYEEAIRRECRDRLPRPLVPAMVRSEDFTGDFQTGLLALTLELS